MAKKRRRLLGPKEIARKHKRWYRDAIRAYPHRGHGWGLYVVAFMWVQHLEREGFITVNTRSAAPDEAKS